MNSVLLIHGGLWEDVGGDWFWRRTGVIDGLAGRGLTVVAPDRLRRAASWTAEAAQLASAPGVSGLTALGRLSRLSGGSGGSVGSVTVVGGSFGCAVAVRLALDFPGLVGRLVLAWPASLSDPSVATRIRSGLSGLGAPPAVLDALLGTGTLPSAADDALRALTVPVAVIPSVPPNPLHPRSAVSALLRLLPSAVALPGCPEAPRPEFAPCLETFIDAVTVFASG